MKEIQNLQLYKRSKVNSLLSKGTIVLMGAGAVAAAAAFTLFVPHSLAHMVGQLVHMGLHQIGHIPWLADKGIVMVASKTFSAVNPISLPGPMTPLSMFIKDKWQSTKSDFAVMGTIGQHDVQSWVSAYTGGGADLGITIPSFPLSMPSAATPDYSSMSSQEAQEYVLRLLNGE
eukprot:scpid92240/ scgid6369/ 